MFKNIYYNSRSNKVTLWETYNGKTSVLTEDLEYKYFTKPQNGEEPTAYDIYGRPLVSKISSNIFDLKEKTKLYKSMPGFYSAETDIEPEVKFLQERYGSVELKPNPADFNIGYFDIEVAVGHTGHSNKHKIKIRKIKND